MNESTQFDQILKALEEIKSDNAKFREEIKSDNAKFRDEIKSENAKFRDEIKSENAKFRDEIKSENAKFRDEIKSENAKFREEIKNGNARFRQEMKSEFRNLRSDMLKLHDAQAKKIEFLDGNVRAFRDELLTTMDFIRKDYESFDEDQAMTSAGLDRLQNGFDANKAAYQDLRAVVEDLTSRVDAMEAAQA